MSMYSDFERSQMIAMKDEEERDLDCILCPKCKGQWFEEVRLQQYQNQKQVVIGQSVPEKPGTIPFIMLRCIHCSNLVEPRVIHTTRDLAGASYKDFLDTINGEEKGQLKEKQKNQENKIDTKEV